MVLAKEMKIVTEFPLFGMQKYYTISTLRNNFLLEKSKAALVPFEAEKLNISSDI